MDHVRIVREHEIYLVSMLSAKRYLQLSVSNLGSSPLPLQVVLRNDENVLASWHEAKERGSYFKDAAEGRLDSLDLTCSSHA